MNDNIYSAPQSDLATDSNDEQTLASRTERFFASLVDGITIMIFTMPAMYFTGGFDGITEGAEPSLSYTLLISALGFVIFFLINAKLLVNKGQTIGKKTLGIKIVDTDGNLPEVKKHLIKRYAVYFIPGQIPLAGQLFSLINILFIFGKQRRCIHDLVAGTKVISA